MSSTDQKAGVAPYTEDDLFMGSEVVYFKEAEGITYNYAKDNFVEAEGKDLVEAAQRRFKPVSYLGEDYSHMIIPAIPATDIQATPDTKVDSWPEGLQKPLIKCKEGDSAIKYTGVASGVRSALVKLEGNWYRLKGSGNNDEGFIFQTINKNSHLVNIRGSSFEHTTHRELYMTEKVNELLEPYGLIGTNKSLGYYEYTLPEKTNPLPLVKRTCVVCQTFGNRRLQDHVLCGLENILPSLVSSVDAAAISSHFPAQRTMDSVDGPLSTWMASMYGMELTSFLTQDIKEQTIDAKLPDGIDERWSNLWKTEAEKWNKFVAESRGDLLTEHKVGSVLGYLAYRLGWEAGICQKALNEAEISWGTYSDPMGTHCNAHTNNLSLRIHENDDQPFLAMCDLDMAFSKVSHVFQTPDGDKDDEEFKKWITLEPRMLGMALAGDPEVSTGIKFANVTLSKEHTSLKWALRDTMMIAYNTALKQDGQEAVKRIPVLTGAGYSLLKLACVTTMTNIA